MFVRLRRSYSAAAARRRLVLGVTLNDIPTVFSVFICRCIALRNTFYVSELVVVKCSAKIKSQTPEQVLRDIFERIISSPVFSSNVVWFGLS